MIYSRARPERLAHVLAGTATFDAEDDTAEWAVGPYAWWPEDRYLAMAELQQLDVGAAVAHAAEVVRSLSPWRDIAVDGVRLASTTETSRWCFRRRWCQ